MRCDCKQDPDWHDGTHDSAAAWFAHFMLRYITAAQLARLGLAGAALHLGFGFDVPSLALFWAMPSVLSAVQLFAFGTYLPHRSVTGAPHVDAHRARSLPLSDAASLLSCLNFGGCHHEHHAYPAVPWWRLLRLRAALRAARHER
jgi:beta-carotene ketolase (CrtW type)